MGLKHLWGGLKAQGGQERYNSFRSSVPLTLKPRQKSFLGDLSPMVQGLIGYSSHPLF